MVTYIQSTKIQAARSAPSASASQETGRRTRPPDVLGILPIHASAVCANGGALVFLGPSGTGKSTICGLLSADTRTLADDIAYLIPEGERWMVADADPHAFLGPFSGQEAAALGRVPLRGIFRLYQSPGVHLEPIDALQLCRHLANAFFDFPRHRHFDIATKRAIYARLAALARTVPGYHFYFDRSPQVRETLRGIGF